MHYLYQLVPLRPPPTFKVAIQVSAYAWDQYYMREHCVGKGGEYRGRKSVSTTGFTHTWRKITNIHTVEAHRTFEPRRPHARASDSLRSHFVCTCADRGASHGIHADGGRAEGDHNARAVHGATVERLPPPADVAGAHRVPGLYRRPIAALTSR